MKTGVYRFDVLPNGDQSWVTVRSGYGEATGRGPAVRVNSGQQVRFRSDNSLQHTAQKRARSRRLRRLGAGARQAAGRFPVRALRLAGRDWLSGPGRLRNLADRSRLTATVWVPTSVPAGWAPYRYGHWAWIAPWGWTWVDDAPWGFAPFHYGRWVSWNGGWGWAPGPLGYWNPYYAPALVGWIGGRASGSASDGAAAGALASTLAGSRWAGVRLIIRAIADGDTAAGTRGGGGWVSSDYLRNVNVTNTHITNINNITNNYYHNNFAGVNVNRNVPGAVTAAPKSAFTSGAAINRVGVAVPQGTAWAMAR